MDSEARHPDTTGRLRVVDLRIGSERRLHFGGGFACVVAATDARSAAARWIAATIVGPPPTDSGPERRTVIDDSGPFWRLQSPVLPLRAPAVLDLELLQQLWRSDCARRLEVLAASRGSLASEQQRIRTALDQLRYQPPLPAASGSRPSPAQAEAELAAFKDAARRFVRVQLLLAEIDQLHPEPSPEALELADAWDARFEPIPPEPEPPPAVSTTEPEPSAPRPPAAPPAPSGIPSERGAELERLHRTVVKAEARIFGRRVLLRKRAIARYNSAVGRERAALAGAGVDTYAEFLLESSEAEPDDPARRAPADRSTVTNRDGEEAARALEARAVDERTQEERAQAERARQGRAQEKRAHELRARARELLGREVDDDDLATELRAHLVDHPVLVECVEELADVLREGGLATLHDVVGQARDFIATPPSVHIPQPPTWAMRVARPDVPLRETEALEQQLITHGELVDVVETEVRRLEATRDANLLRLGPEDIARVIGALFDAYRAGEVLEGHLPLVLDGVLDGLAADSRDAAVIALASARDVQVIVVTDDDRVGRLITAAGGTIVRWPAPEGQRQGDLSL